jgi:hypothetical protein
MTTIVGSIGNRPLDKNNPQPVQQATEARPHTETDQSPVNSSRSHQTQRRQPRAPGRQPWTALPGLYHLTSSSTATSAEAGAWTRPDHRGRGLAVADTRAWWQLERRAKTVSYYSTDSDNAASQAVARKRDLDPLGWIWTLR